mmetsp:Transcript_13167/g.18518  ORF Transcript_13167/g.18518 Transcript_13167/m.18518 type:complete len:186 (+) Transcript_13167:57-614(+)
MEQDSNTQVTQPISAHPTNETGSVPVSSPKVGSSEPVPPQQLMQQMYNQLINQPGLLMMPFMFPGQYPLFQRMPMSGELQENPTYVNAKQYKRILKRREARAKLEERKKIPSDRKSYLHKSRHDHACRRKRGPGGRFLTKSEVESSQQMLTNRNIQAVGDIKAEYASAANDDRQANQKQSLMVDV